MEDIEQVKKRQSTEKARLEDTNKQEKRQQEDRHSRELRDVEDANADVQRQKTGQPNDKSKSNNPVGDLF